MDIRHDIHDYVYDNILFQKTHTKQCYNQNR